MNEQHRTSLALSKRLKELGVPQESEFYWLERFKPQEGWYLADKDWLEDRKPYQGERFCSAFLASELLEYLPSIGQRGNLIIKKIDTHQYKVSHGRGHWIIAYDLEEALARFLIYLKEKGLV